MIITLGDLVADILINTRGPIQYGSDVSGKIKLQGGGSAANFAAWASYLEDEVSFIGRIGNDPFGVYLKKELINQGVQPYLTTDLKESTGTILILIDENGERSMITDRGANLNISTDDLPINIFSRAEHLHLTGYSFFGNEEIIKTSSLALNTARNNSLTISIDPSSYGFLKEFSPERFIELTRDSDFLFPNLDEGKILTGLIGPEAIVEKLLEYYKVVILKLGSGGCIIGDSIMEKICRIETNQSENFKVLDTTGAGDAFAAAFIKSFYEFKDLRKAGRYAHKVGGMAVQKIGGRPPL